MTFLKNIQVHCDDFFPDDQYDWLAQCRPGAICMFIGLVRQIYSSASSNQNYDNQALYIEHYPGMSESKLTDFVTTATQNWSLQAVTLIHRYGRLLPQDRIVLVGVASAHRKDAFAACEYIMDYLKTDAPFWKKEIYADQENWLDSTVDDLSRRNRWHK